jgi:hypothetical protein
MPVRMWMRIQIQGFDDQKMKKKKIQTGKHINSFLIKNSNLFIPRPPQRTSIVAQATEEAYRHQKRTKTSSFLTFFFFLWVILTTWIRIRIQQTKFNDDPDPDPKHCNNVTRYTFLALVSHLFVSKWAAFE